MKKLIIFLISTLSLLSSCNTTNDSSDKYYPLICMYTLCSEFTYKEDIYSINYEIEYDADEFVFIGYLCNAIDLEFYKKEDNNPSLEYAVDKTNSLYFKSLSELNEETIRYEMRKSKKNDNLAIPFFSSIFSKSDDKQKQNLNL